MCEDCVPHEGQDAIGDVVRRVRVISSAPSTPSIWTSGRSRKMIIGFGWSLEKVSIGEKMFNFPVYHIYFQQGCVRSTLWFKESATCTDMRQNEDWSDFVRDARQG